MVNVSPASAYSSASSSASSASSLASPSATRKTRHSRTSYPLQSSSSSSSSRSSRRQRRSILHNSTPIVLLSAALLFTLAQVASAASLDWASTDRLSFFGKRAENARARVDPFAPLPNAVDYYNPREKGGLMKTIIPDLGDLGEPLNVIISGRSSASVLKPVGFLLWATSVNMGVSCLGQANGTEQSSNLGDGKGAVHQGTGDGDNGVLRFNYYSAYLGTCKETFDGGNHLRWWMQNGTEANSSAIFMAVSLEKPVAQNHDIQPNGYNLGRDELVGNATLAGGTEWEGNVFNTTVTWVPAGLLLNATSDGINHADTVPVDGQPAQDGRVAVLTITQKAGSSGDNSSPAGLGKRFSTAKVLCMVATTTMLGALILTVT